jgi:LPXTG-site transpeptidase (sortase) family protein
MLHRWTLVMLALVAAGALACGRGGGSPAPTSTPTAASAAHFPTSDAPLARLVIPSIELNQPTVPGTVDAKTNTMVAPEKPFDIAYYDFSARPGRGNAIFAGHLDYIRVGAAAFWRLRDLRPGDEVQLQLADGMQLHYRVTMNKVFDPQTGPWNDLFKQEGAPDEVTLVTCDGGFDPSSHEYAERRVVQAVRVG